MRDITSKYSTLRVAVARGSLLTQGETIKLLQAGKLPKGDPLPVARVAAIQAAKNTCQIIPYCHQVPLDHVQVDFQVGEATIAVEATANAIHKTGVEMEALTAVSVGLLTLYDMLKPVDDQMSISGITLVRKTGGKSDYVNEFSPPPRAAVLVMSDSVSAGRNEDKSGPLIVERLKTEGVVVEDYRVIADDRETIEQWLLNYTDRNQLDLVITCGGTGFSPRDNTPEAMERIIEREVPGIPEAARAFGQARMPYAMLARGQAGIRGSTLIVNLPGSAKGTADYLNVIFPALLHAVRMIRGEGHAEHPPINCP
jgi:cyclic pyranopterin monophosphate synthase